MNKTHLFILMLSAASLLGLSACKKGKPSEERHERALRQIQNAYEERDYQELLTLADSLYTIGELGEAEAYYWQGYACDRTKQLRMAEFYWKTAIAQTESSTEPGDLDIYAKSASHLANVLGMRGEYDAVLDMAKPVVKRLEELKCDTTSDYNNLILIMGLCQSRFGLSKDDANESYERAYQTHMKNIEANRSDVAYKNAIAGVVNIAFNYNETKVYREALMWIDRYAELIRQYEQRNDADPAYVDRQWARYDIYRAIALDGQGKKEEAAKVYDHYLTTQYSKMPEGRIAVIDYLAAAGRWEEAADNYACLDEMLGRKNYSIEDFQKMVLPKFKANMKAGRRDSAMVVALEISESLDSAITKARKQDAEELSTIRQKATLLADEEAFRTRLRTINLLVAIALVFGGLSLYTLYRRRKTHRLVKKYHQLQADYNEMESSKTIHTQGILEQNIARHIQEAMMPGPLTKRDDIHMFATLKPADEIDCDLYDYFIQNDKLYFCIGDAIGKGIDASTAMAITRTEFRTRSIHMTDPAQIVTSINKALTSRDNNNMGVTLLVGIIDLETGRLCYTNAGHTAPMLVGSGIGLLPVDQNAAVGTHADFHYNTQETRIDPGTLIFLYNQDLLQAKNAADDAYGDRRMLGESLQATKVLKEKLTAESFTNWMKEAVGRFMGEGVEKPMTMVALQYKLRKPGDPYQRSLTISNDPKNEAYITYFTTEACAAVGMNKTLGNAIAEEMVNVVKNLVKEAYPDGTKGDVNIEARTEDADLQFIIAAGEKTVTLKKTITK